jgi:hypothetical protein
MKKSALEGDLADDKRRLFTNITNSILDNTSGFIDTLKPLGRTVNKGTLANAFSSAGEKGAYGAVRGAVGSAFEIGVKTALNYTALDSQRGFGDFDVRGGKNLKNLQKLFGFSTILGDFKGSLSNDNLQSFAGKIYKEVGMTQFGRFSTAKGKKASVHPTGSPVSESATAGATNAANVGIGAAYKNKPAKAAKNKDGTVKNALDMKANLITGGSIKR